MKTIKNETGEYIVVEVPKNSLSYGFGYNEVDMCNTLHYTVKTETGGDTNNFGNTLIHFEDVDLDTNQNLTLLGTLHYDNGYVFSFDPTEYTERNRRYWRDYSVFIGIRLTFLETPELSFISFLNANDIWLVNPYYPEPKCDEVCSCNEAEVHDCMGDHVLWSEAESKVIKGKLVIIKRIDMEHKKAALLPLN